MGRDYKKIKAWQLSNDLVYLIYKVTKHFPVDELYGLTSQMRRAAISVPANIVEGSSRGSKKDFYHFLTISKGSLAELGYYIYLSNRLNYLSEKEYSQLFNLQDEAAKTLYGFMQVILSDI